MTGGGEEFLTNEEIHRVGLCARCFHAAVIRNNRGSMFYRCERSETDPRYVKYPRLPVRVCPGYEQKP